MKILKACCAFLVATLIIFALAGASTQQEDTVPDQTANNPNSIKVTSIDAITGTIDYLHADATKLSALPQPSHHYLPMKLYERSGEDYVEVDFITDDFDTLPERWLYVLQPNHEYVAVVDLSISPLSEPSDGGCFLFSNNLSAGDVGSICLISTGLRTTESTATPIIVYSQTKFVTDDDISLRHGKVEQLVGRAGYYDGKIYLQLTCRGGTMEQDAVEQATYCAADDANEAVKLEVYGSRNGVCTPYELDSDTYLWPSQHQKSELQDIFRQINGVCDDLYRTAEASSVTYAISKTKP